MTNNKYKVDAHNGIEYKTPNKKDITPAPEEEITLIRQFNPKTETYEYKTVAINHRLLWEEEEEMLKNQIFEIKRKVIE